MKASWRQPVGLLLVTGLFWLLLDADDVHAAVLEGLSLCAGSVIPALFPFLAVASLLLKLGFGEWLARPMAPLLGLYRIGGAGGSALVLGLCGGYPVGARTTAELYESGQLTRDEAERLLTFVNNANPAFFLNVLGRGVFGSVRAGLWLWLIHVAAALITGLLLSRGKGGGRTVYRPVTAKAVRFSDALVESISGALTAMLSICAFVVFFYVLALPLREIAGPMATAAVGALELFSATPRLTANQAGFVLAAALSGWGGVSVLCQTAAVLAESGLSTRPVAAGKAVQAGLSALLAAAVVWWL